MSIKIDGNGVITGTSNVLTAGTVAYFPMTTPPPGWIKANGASISREAYAALFVSIGTTFGTGDGSTTFTLPDLRGEFIRALDDGRGVDLGRPLGAAQADAMQAHAHTAAGNVTGSPGAPYNAFMVGAGSSFGESLSGRMGIGEASVSSQGTPRLAGETRPRNVALLACIKT